MRFDRLEYAVGETALVTISAPKRLRLPALIVRYSVPLRTKDGRSLDVFFDPETAAESRVAVSRRGAYYAAREVLTLRDAFGFFVAELQFAAEEDPRLLALPEAKPFEFMSEPRSGGEAFRHEPRYSRTDELTESRRYLPGDDPRRINWKLYGHSGELFVRDGEPEPPPRSRCVVLVDSSVDAELFSDEAGEAALDALADTALGLVAELLDSGLEVDFGISGMPLCAGTEKQAASCFAGITRHPVSGAPELPLSADPKMRTVVFALPRRLGRSAKSALDVFLGKRSAASGSVELLFLALPGAAPVEAVRSPWAQAVLRSPAVRRTKRADSEAAAAVLSECLVIYGAKGGVRARRMEV